MKDYQYYLETIGEYGVAKGDKYPIILIEGLHKAHINEMVVSEAGHVGMVFAIERNTIQVLLFSSERVKLGTSFVRTDEFIAVPVGESMFGWVIDPLGRPYFGKGQYVMPDTQRYIDPLVKGISERVRIDDSFLTGVTLIDMMIPMGKGQKELVIGDKKVGKTSFILNAVKKQVQDGVIVIYACTGRKKNDIKKVYEFCVAEKIDHKVIIVAASSNESPSLIYISPFAAMTIAEYFRDKGLETLVVIDDLSTHAKFYREISLVGDHFPGRESYPGDIFYLHARLLERAGNFTKPDGKGSISITCLPVCETVESDLAGYIPTNVMGMTDGHIFFDSNAFYNGLRPAINIGLSVTRVGKQTLSHLRREINHELTAFLSQYEKMESYSHFGAELSGKVTKMLKKGVLIYELFQQHFKEIYTAEIQLIIFGLIWSTFVESKEQLQAIKAAMIAKSKDPTAVALFKKICEADTLYKFLTNITLYKDQIFALCGIPLPKSPQQTASATPAGQPAVAGTASQTGAQPTPAQPAAPAPQPMPLQPVPAQPSKPSPHGEDMKKESTPPVAPVAVPSTPTPTPSPLPKAPTVSPLDSILHTLQKKTAPPNPKMANIASVPQQKTVNVISVQPAGPKQAPAQPQQPLSR